MAAMESAPSDLPAAIAGRCDEGDRQRPIRRQAEDVFGAPPRDGSARSSRGDDELGPVARSAGPTAKPNRNRTNRRRSDHRTWFPDRRHVRATTTLSDRTTARRATAHRTPHTELDSTSPPSRPAAANHAVRHREPLRRAHNTPVTSPIDRAQWRVGQMPDPVATDIRGPPASAGRATSACISRHTPRDAQRMSARPTTAAAVRRTLTPRFATDKKTHHVQDDQRSCRRAPTRRPPRLWRAAAPDHRRRPARRLVMADRRRRYWLGDGARPPSCQRLARTAMSTATVRYGQPRLHATDQQDLHAGSAGRSERQVGSGRDASTYC